jgi:hypothetical protein
MVCIIERARAEVAALGVAVGLFAAAVWGELDGRAREVAEEVEGLAECRLRAAIEAQRVHAVRCMAGEKEAQDMVTREGVIKVEECAQAGTSLVASVAGGLAWTLSSHLVRGSAPSSSLCPRRRLEPHLQSYTSPARAYQNSDVSLAAKGQVDQSIQTNAILYPAIWLRHTYRNLHS